MKTRLVRYAVLSAVAVTVLLSIVYFGSTQAEPTDLKSLARQSLARIDGRLDMPGLQAEVEVIRDKWGVPHIYAQNVEDLFFAHGYVMAQDRLWQLDQWRRWREGRLSEIYGPAAFDYDHRNRLLMYRGPWDDSEWKSYHPEGKRIFAAYANGINAYINENLDNLPVEFKLTGVTPGQWTAETVVLRMSGLAYASGRSHALAEMQLAMDVAKLGAAEANRRQAPDPSDDLKVPEGLDVKIITEPIIAAMRAGDSEPFDAGGLPNLEIVNQYRPWVSGPPTARALPTLEDLLSVGSNNWAVRGNLSVTGKPLIAGDPHRPISNPSLRYYVHLNAPGWNVIGATEPPFIGVHGGHNEHIAWAFTFAGADMHDVFVEEMHPTDNNLVKWQNEWVPLRVIREEIPVKGEAPRAVEFKFSRHGPIFYEDTVNRRAYALKSSLHEPGTANNLGSLQLAQAASCQDFFERAMHWKAPSHSTICGDAEGNIAFQASALTPDRDGWNGRLPVPGTGKYEWRGFRSDLPREFNPEHGFVATANNNIHPSDYKGRPVMYHSKTGVEYSRITRIRQMLKPDHKYSIEDFRKMQLDAYSLQAAADIPLFKDWTSKDPEIERARALIAEWDAVLLKDSRPAALYVTWTRVAGAAARNRNTAAGNRQRLIEEGLKKTIEKLTADIGSNWEEWRYGRIHYSEFAHPLLSEFDLPTVERNGGFGTVAATGVSFRQVMDPSDWDRSIFSITPGQSGQPESPFYGNLLQPWANGEYFPLSFSRS
jgi:penicillin amidase